MDEERLRYRRQFLISTEKISELNHWRCMELHGGFRLHVHPDLELTISKSGKIILLGSLYDAFDPARTNEEIVGALDGKCPGLNDFLKEMKNFSGRYAAMFLTPKGFAIMHDPIGIREVYYTTGKNRIICGSQPNVIARFSEPHLEERTEEEVRYFYENEMRSVRDRRFWIGDETYYKGIKHLLPNHYLLLENREVIRHWPDCNPGERSLEEVVERCSSFLKGTMDALTRRHKIMAAVTSGFDSRTVLAASRDFTDRIYFFVNKEKPMADNHSDVTVPQAMLTGIGVPFHVHHVPDHMDESFRKIFLDNTFLSNDHIVTTVYNVYFKEHQDKVNILGVGEIGRNFYDKPPRWLNGYFLARSVGFRRSSYAERQCSRWLERTLPRAEKYGIDILTLYLWDQLLGNWACVGNSESDIAIDEQDPYNSYYMYETLLSIDKRFSMHNNENILFVSMIKEMWPELLDYPINPPFTTRGKIMGFIKGLPVYRHMRNVYYRAEYLRFRNAMR